jgi:hypothetical protein
MRMLRFAVHISKVWISAIEQLLVILSRVLLAGAWVDAVDFKAPGGCDEDAHLQSLLLF